MTAEIKQHLEDNFDFTGKIKVNPNGIVDVDGDVRSGMIFMDGTLGVQFGTVTGDFKIGMANIKTLKGSPLEVGGTFECVSNDIQSLEGAPIRVGGDFIIVNNKHLRSLDGLPKNINGIIRLSCLPELGLLRLITNDIKNIELQNAPDDLNKIFKKYMGKPTPGARKSAAIACSLELIRAGFKGNARL